MHAERGEQQGSTADESNAHACAGYHVRVMARSEFDRLLEEAEQVHARGDDAYLRERLIEEPLIWDYAGIVRSRFNGAESLLDLDTGDGERLAAMAPLPRVAVATEPWEVNVVRAAGRLRAVGASVVQTDQEADNACGPVDGNYQRRLPLADESFDLVICRHGSFAAREVARVLKPGGWFMAQLVGHDNHRELNEALGGPMTVWGDLRQLAPTLEEAGLEIVDRREDKPGATFRDIGAVVSYLLAVPWQIADFSIVMYRERLLKLHERMLEDHGLRTHAHRHLIVAHKR